MIILNILYILLCDNDNIVGFVKQGIYNVYEVKDMTHEASNGYVWYRTDGFWFADIGDGVELYQPIELPTDDKYKEMLQQIVDMASAILK